MSIIVVEDLVKSFKLQKREEGLGGAVKGLFHRGILHKNSCRQDFL